MFCKGMKIEIMFYSPYNQKGRRSMAGLMGEFYSLNINDL